MMKPKDIPALLNKRAELTAEIQIAERRLASLRANLASIEGTIGAFALSRTPAGRAQRAHDAAASRSAQVSRAILDVLRRAGEPLSERDIMVRVGNAAMVPSQVRRALRRHLKRRLVQLVEPAEAGLWMIALPP